MKSFLVFFINFYFGSKLLKGDCLSYDSKNSEKCSACAIEFYNSNEQAGNQIENILDCKRKSMIPYKKIIFVSQGGCRQLSCNGTREFPFRSILYALNALTNDIKQFLFSEIKIILLGETHFILTSDLKDNHSEILRRSMVDIEIEPELSNQNAKIFFKTNNFTLFVSKSLTLKNIKLLGNDISSRDKNCGGEPILCCNEESLLGEFTSNECGLKGYIANQSIDTKNNGLFNMEYIKDLSVPIIPLLRITNCSFENFNIFNKASGFTSIVGFQDKMPFSITFENTSFNSGIFEKGIIFFSFKEETLQGFFLITQNGLIIDLNKNASFILGSKIMIYNVTVTNFNKAGIINGDENLITVEEFYGTILITNMKVISSLISGSVFQISASGDPLSSKISMNNLSISGIKSNCLMKIGYNEMIEIDGFSLDKNNLTAGFLIFSTCFTIRNIEIYDSQLPEDNLFKLWETCLILDQLKILNMKSLYPETYLIRSTTILVNPITAFINSPFLKDIPYTKDRIVISNSKIENGDFLLFTYDYAIFSLELINTSVKNFSIQSSRAFIDILCEKELLFLNSTFDLLNLQGRFVFCKFGRNLTFYACRLSNSVLSGGFDYFVQAWIIADYYKLISNFSHCVLINLKLANANGLQPCRFFFYNPFSTKRGFYLAYFENMTAQNITADDLQKNAIFMAVAAGRLKILHSAFIDLGNIGIHRFYPRLSDSDTELRFTIYRLHDYKLNYVFMIDADYFIKLLVIQNCFITANREFSNHNAFSFLNTDKFVFSDNIVQNILSTFGNSIMVKLASLNNFIAERNLFYNNSGSNGIPADLFIDTRVPSDINFQLLSKFSNRSLFGLHDSVFILSRTTGSIFLNDEGQLLIENCRFLLVEGESGGCLRAGQRSQILLQNITIMCSSSSHNGGAIYLLNTLIILNKVQFIRTTAKYFGGAIMFSRNAVVEINDCFFEFSQATRGGVLWGESSTVFVKNSNFNQSQAFTQGGHICIKESYLEVTNSSLAFGNSSNSGSMYGEKIILIMENTNLTNCNSETSIIHLSGVDGSLNILKNFRCEFNSALSSASLIYAFDLELRMEDCIVNSNFAFSTSMINIFYSTVNTSLKIIGSIFKNNKASRSLIESSVSLLYVTGSLFKNNLVSNQVLYVRRTVLIASRNLFKKSILDTNIECVFIYIEKSPSANISLTVFDAALRGIHLEVRNSKTIKIMDCLFENGFSSTSSGICKFLESDVVLIGSAFFNNSGLAAGVLLSYNTNINLRSCSFVRNSGSDIAISSVSKHNENNYASLKGAFFQSSQYCSMHVQSGSVIIESSYFSGLLRQEVASSALQIDSVIKFSIYKTLLKDFFGNSTISGANALNNNSELSFLNSIFLSSKSLTDGAFLNLNGRINVSITSCYFFGGFSSGNGGSIAYDCLPPFCLLDVNGTTIFEENFSRKMGQAIYSPNFAISFSLNDVRFISPGNSSDLYSTPSNMVTVFNLSSFEDLENFAASNDLQASSNHAHSTINSFKGGENFNLGVILFDQYGNIQTSHSNAKIYLTTQSTEVNVEIRNNYAELKAGLAFFEEIRIVGELNKSYSLILRYSQKESILEKELVINLDVCSRGEILYFGICMECPVDSYSLEYIYSEVPNLECLKCPKNALCPNSTIIKKCYFSQACPLQEAWFGNSNLGQFQCGEGFWGNLCKICSPNFFPSQKGCLSCTDPWNKLFFVLKLARSAVFTLLECQMILSRLASPDRTLLKILFLHSTYLTILTEEKLEFSREIGEILDMLKNIFSVSTIDIFNFECLLYRNFSFEDIYAASLVIKLSSILIFSIFIFVTLVIKEIFRVFWIEDGTSLNSLRKVCPKFKSYLIIVILVTFRNFYRIVLLNTMTLFKCENLYDDSIKFLSDNPNIVCWESRHVKYLAGVTLTGIIFWSIIFQLVVFLYIKEKKKLSKTYKNSMKNRELRFENGVKKTYGFETRKKIQSWRKMGNIMQKMTLQESDLGLKKQPNDDFIFLYLTMDYKENFYFWINIEYASILFLVLLPQITTELEDELRKMILIASFCTLFAIYKVISPMTLKIHSKMIKFSLVVCILSIFSQILTSEKDAEPGKKFIAQYLISISNGAFYFISIIFIMKLKCEGKKKVLDTIMNRIFPPSNRRKVYQFPK